MTNAEPPAGLPGGQTPLRLACPLGMRVRLIHHRMAGYVVPVLVVLLAAGAGPQAAQVVSSSVPHSPARCC
jgi:hypothetical protein